MINSLINNQLILINKLKYFYNLIFLAQIFYITDNISATRELSMTPCSILISSITLLLIWYTALLSFAQWPWVVTWETFHILSNSFYSQSWRYKQYRGNVSDLLSFAQWLLSSEVVMWDVSYIIQFFLWTQLQKQRGTFREWVKVQRGIQMRATSIKLPRGKSEESKRKKELLEVVGSIRYDVSH